MCPAGVPCLGVLFLEILWFACRCVDYKLLQRLVLFRRGDEVAVLARCRRRESGGAVVVHRYCAPRACAEHVGLYEVYNRQDVPCTLVVRVWVVGVVGFHERVVLGPRKPFVEYSGGINNFLAYLERVLHYLARPFVYGFLHCLYVAGHVILGVVGVLVVAHHYGKQFNLFGHELAAGELGIFVGLAV